MLSITGSLRSKGLIVVSLFVWVLAVWILVFNEGKMEAPGVFILNTRFALFALATIGLSYTYLIRKKDPITNGLNLFLFAGLITIIVGTLFENYHLVSDSHYRNLGYSFVLTFYAIAFLVPGFVFSSPSFRKGGITVIIALILKLYLYDIWTMSLIVKIIAGFSFGTGLILTSIFYEKFKNKLLG
jgi:hypothetical protein